MENVKIEKKPFNYQWPYWEGVLRISLIDSGFLIRKKCQIEQIYVIFINYHGFNFTGKGHLRCTTIPRMYILRFSSGSVRIVYGEKLDRHHSYVVVIKPSVVPYANINDLLTLTCFKM